MKYRLALEPIVLPTTSGNLYRVEAIRDGKWDYPEPGGEGGFEITPEIRAEFESNFKAGIGSLKSPLGGYRESINVDHDNESSTDDCGWLVNLENEADKLYAYFEITDPLIKEKVDRGELAYCSSELDFGWQDPERTAAGDETVFRVFEGLALTNKPFVKALGPIEPILLSERKPEKNELTEDAPPDDTPGEPGKATKEAKLTEQEIEKLKADLAEANAKLVQAEAKVALSENAGTESKKALAEVRRLSRTIALGEFKTKLTAYVRKGKVSPAVAKRALRLGTALILGGSSVVTLDEKVKVAKVKLAEGDSGGEDELDKLDVIGEVVDMLGQLPDAVAMDVTSDAELDESGPDDKGDMDGAELKKCADKHQSTNPKLTRREAYALARRELGENKGGKR